MDKVDITQEQMGNCKWRDLKKEPKRNARDKNKTKQKM